MFSLRIMKRNCSKSKQVEGVVAASPVIYTQLALLPKNRDTIESTIYLKGIDLRKEDNVTGFSKFVAGSVDFSGAAAIKEARERAAGRETIVGGIILGHHVADRLQVSRGDMLRLIFKMEESPVHPGNFLPLTRNFVIIGLYESGMYTYDNAFGFIDLETAQKAYGKPNEINMIEVRIVDADLAPGDT